MISSLVYDIATNNPSTQVKGLVLENTFTSVEDMVGQIIPPLGFLIGTGRPLNALVTNKWYSYKTLPGIKSVPILMFVSGQVRSWAGKYKD